MLFRYFFSLLPVRALLLLTHHVCERLSLLLLRSLTIFLLFPVSFIFHIVIKLRRLEMDLGLEHPACLLLQTLLSLRPHF